MRRYGQLVGDPHGQPENKTRCVAEVPYGWLFRQCSRKRGKGPDGLYCGIHARQLALGRHVNVPGER